MRARFAGTATGNQRGPRGGDAADGPEGGNHLCQYGSGAAGPEKGRALIRRTILLAQSHGHSSFFPFIAEAHAKMKSRKA